MKTIDRLVLGATIACVTSCVDAAAPSSTPTPDEIRLRTALQKAHPGTHFSHVSRTPIPDFYEVWMGSTLAFVSRKNVRYLVFGRVFDTKTMVDLTAPKLANRDRIPEAAAEQENIGPATPIAELPLADAIKTIQGNGERVLAVFSDPACPHCKRLESELGKLDNVTIYTFLVPFLGATLPTAIWCAADRQKAWRHYMVRGDPSLLADVSDASACPHPLESNLALAARLNVRGTPTLLYADGRRIAGYVTTSDIEAGFASAQAPVRGTDVLPDGVLP